jgi:hypothetical protein
MKHIWVIQKNADMTEGRGPMIFTGIAFTKLEDAKEYISKQYGVMGTKGESPKQLFRDQNIWSANAHEAELVTVYDSLDSFKDDQDCIDKLKALNKLSPREKELLGL